VPSFWPRAGLTAARLQRMRFTPGKECAAVATLSLEPFEGESPRVVVTFAPRDDLLEAAKGLKHTPAANVYSPELGCLAEVFPSDWRLRHLRQVMTPELMLAGVSQALRLPASDSDRIEVRLLRYRPHSRAVMHYAVKDASGSTHGEAVGKVYRSEGKAKRMWRILESVYTKTYAAPVIPRPLAFLKDTDFVLMEKAPGRPLENLLRTADGEAIREALRLTAEALHAFHDVDPGDLKPRKVSKDIDDIEKLAKRVRAEAEATFDVRALIKVLEFKAETLRAPRKAVLTHGSCKPSAILSGDGRVTFVDLDAVVAGDPARDVGCFASKLRAMALSPGQERLAGFADDFVNLYTSSSTDPELIERVHLYEAIFLAGLGLKHLNTSWRGEEEGSPALALISQARRLLLQPAA
jgi:aminoglycoside phosphotransferase